MSIETQLRDALTSHAGSIESVEAHPYERVAGAVAKNRARRRTVGAAAVAVVAAIAIGVPTVSSRLADGRTTPAGTSVKLPPATDKAWKSVTTWPTRGALAGDSALVAAIGEQFDGRPIFVEDLGPTRVAVVVSRADLVVGTGPRGAGASGMRRSSASPVSDVADGVLSMAGRGDLVVLTAPDRKSVEVSKTPDIALDGTVSRTWQPLALTKGVGHTDWTELTRLRLRGLVSWPLLGFMDPELPPDSSEPCGDDCNLDLVKGLEKDTNDLVANRLDLDPKTVTTTTVFNGPVSPDFVGPELGSPAVTEQILHVMHTRLPGGQILRTAQIRSGDITFSLQETNPIDARRPNDVPLIAALAGETDDVPLSVNVFVANGTAVRAVSDSPSVWPSSNIVPLTGHVARFDLPVSYVDFGGNYRLEVLDGDRVISTVRTTVRSIDPLDGTP